MDAFLTLLGGSGGTGMSLGSTSGTAANGGWSTTAATAGSGDPASGYGGGGKAKTSLAQMAAGDAAKATAQPSPIQMPQARPVDINQLLAALQKRGGLGT